MKIYPYNNKRNICGSKIKFFRKSKKLSQQELTARLQVSGISLERDSISRIESGSRFVSDFELKAFADLLGVAIEDLLEETPH